MAGSDFKDYNFLCLHSILPFSGLICSAHLVLTSREDSRERVLSPKGPCEVVELWGAWIPQISLEVREKKENGGGGRDGA